MLILVRFDRIHSLADKDSDHAGFFTALLPCVPNVGETVDIKGEPFVVIDRCWALGSDIPATMYSFVRILPANGSTPPPPA